MSLNVVFVCQSNLHRSRMAEILFQNSHRHIQFRSAGLLADTERTGGRLLNAPLCDWATHIVFLDKGMHQLAKKHFHQYASKFMLTHIDDVHNLFSPVLSECLLKQVPVLLPNIL